MSNCGMGPTTLGVRVSLFPLLIAYGDNIYIDIYWHHGRSSI